MCVVVSTHTRSLAFVSAELKTRDNLFKKLVAQSTMAVILAVKEHTFLLNDFAYVTWSIS